MPEGYAGSPFFNSKVGACRGGGGKSVPLSNLARYGKWLADIDAAIRRLMPLPVIVAKGEAFEEWAASLGLKLLNRGRASTCVHPRGESIVDLTWAFPAAERMVERWKVSGLESLSDYKYVIVLLFPLPGRSCPQRGRPPPRWALNRLDEDSLMAVLHSAIWS